MVYTYYVPAQRSHCGPMVASTTYPIQDTEDRRKCFIDNSRDNQDQLSHPFRLHSSTATTMSMYLVHGTREKVGGDDMLPPSNTPRSSSVLATAWNRH